jgi:DNA-binding NtrC family response regulator
MLLKIIYLDDEPDLCEIFYEEFSSKDVDIVTFTDIDEAIVAAKSRAPDVIFIDYRLPGKTGDEVARAMPEEVPKCLITGESSVDTQYKFKGVFVKPFDRDAIRRVFAEVLERKRAEKL